MRLLALEPRWIHPNLFVFLCPHCKNTLLTCKNVEMSDKDQRLLYERTFGEDWNMLIVPCRQGMAWTFTNPTAPLFENLSVNPSIDASPSGHWHGHITAGEII